MSLLSLLIHLMHPCWIKHLTVFHIYNISLVFDSEYKSFFLLGSGADSEVWIFNSLICSWVGVWMPRKGRFPPKPGQVSSLEHSTWTAHSLLTILWWKVSAHTQANVLVTNVFSNHSFQVLEFAVWFRLYPPALIQSSIHLLVLSGLWEEHVLEGTGTLHTIIPMWLILFSLNNSSVLNLNHLS